jgi:hypothetical protein
MIQNFLIRIGVEMVKMVFKNKKKTTIKKWAIFTYFGNEVRAITNIFSEYNVRTAFRTTNTLEKILKPIDEKNKYDSSGIYKLKCLTCRGFCIG